MVINKFRKLLKDDDTRYDELYHSYSKVKLQLKTLEDIKKKEMEENKQRLKSSVAKNLCILYDGVENALNTSHKIKEPNPEVQNLMLDINTLKKKLKEVMKRFELEEFEPSQKVFDKEKMEASSYVEDKTIQSGTILKIIKKGIMFEGEVIRKPKVSVIK